MELILEQPANSLTPIPARPHGQHISRSGRPCRYLAVSAETPFCKEHLPPPPPGTPEEFVHHLQRLANRFATPKDVTRVLDHIFFALASGTISERKAGILTYIAHTILNSHRAIERRQKLAAERAAARAEAKRSASMPDKLTWNLPR